MERLKKFYWIFTVITLFQILNLIFRFVSEYYGNRFFVLAVVIATIWFGFEIGLNRITVIVLGIILVSLSLLMLFVVWN